VVADRFDALAVRCAHKPGSTFNYEVAGSSSNSLTLRLHAGFDYPFSFPWTMGTVALKAFYTGIDVKPLCVCAGLLFHTAQAFCFSMHQMALISLNTGFKPGFNRFATLGTIYGMPSLTSRCSSSTVWCLHVPRGVIQLPVLF